MSTNRRLITRASVELKVIASTAATLVASLLLAILNAVQDDHALLGSLPTAVQTVILIVAPTVATFLAGYAAKHTPRPSDAP
ncbi:holin [Streptomyces sp. NPDC021020]|uniref:holin n=1 Tax=Streptomyces sp. NPDC021020 TaxID=3365109 RepID=UPI0037A15FED